ncbi:hypothetical protein RRG08_066242 [Elysia crispata]|uniref:Uncharacterized protein n=1 Tax=Elysia crispata TaxID=231223 RepID=A0AAE1BF75_9GAST|nr:hypothetical protein RRG08_066242 [Elysia crispata]
MRRPACALTTESGRGRWTPTLGRADRADRQGQSEKLKEIIQFVFQSSLQSQEPLFQQPTTIIGQGDKRSGRRHLYLLTTHDSPVEEDGEHAQLLVCWQFLNSIDTSPA